MRTILSMKERWRLYDQEMTGVRFFCAYTEGTLCVDQRVYREGAVGQKSAALTYTTLLALVPTLTIILSVAAGFACKVGAEDGTKLFQLIKWS